jgi:rubrerythrin
VTSQDCFQLAERIELLARDVYAEIASHPGIPPDLRQLMLRLADEEERHAQRIRLLAASQRNSQWAFREMRKIGADLRAVATEQEAFLAAARERRGRADLLETVDRLVEMEERFAFVHAEELTATAEASVARLFQALAGQDEWHRALLADARQQCRLRPSGATRAQRHA